ncbi:MAG TPA: hypothetical protein VHZ78_13010 [Rhizomicrobium sp.]|jgi:hypothetical protein|nr:hypothetical protein [Rhizomicrobium sp.]
MHHLKVLIAAAAFAAVPLSAQALTVVNVGAPAVNCVYNATCVVTVTDSVGNFTPPGDSGIGRLQSRTYDGVAPAPAAGKKAYVYRVDMTSVSGATASTCVTKVALLFGPVTAEPYPPGALKDVYVVTSGGLGSVGIASADQTGGMITFTFGGSGVCPGQTGYFFGLTSTVTTPVTGMARLYYSDGSSTMKPARIP